LSHAVEKVKQYEDIHDGIKIRVKNGLQRRDGEMKNIKDEIDSLMDKIRSEKFYK
jgi:hypothetical protein